MARTAVVRDALPSLLKDLRAESLLDAPCGDFNWIRHTRLEGIEYVGVDVVPDLIARNRQMYGRPGRSFFVSDLTKDALPRVDVILCRDCFYHFSFRDIQATVANFKKSRSTYLLATTHTSAGPNRNIATGDWRAINLQRPPFDFPEPLRLLVEDPATSESLGLWRLGDL
ncbi:MAG: class I SAM-dependent methyltransferase [Acidobacteria bacterium]|nr:class I SAM-dependent methyltransferase [Acidobacteriota bacterium]